MLSHGTVFALGVGLVAATPSPISVGSDLSLLFQNDLNCKSKIGVEASVTYPQFPGPTAQDHNGTIVINMPSTNAQAVASCGQLYETLLPTNGTYFESDMNNLLRYLALDTFCPSQMYWVQSSSAECFAISLDGIQTVSCSESLPAFCSQSAPYRPNNRTDMSAQYQVEVSSGNITVLG